jgi:hypothetical protein
MEVSLAGMRSKSRKSGTICIPNRKNGRLYRGRTLMVNASIMDLEYKPTNSPWLIDLDLPKKPQRESEKSMEC